MRKVAVYARVSTREQAEEGYSIQVQLEKLRLFCQAKSWVVIKEYVDAGFSGGSLKRPAMSELIYDAKHRKFDMVLVYKLDRLSRSQKDTLYLVEELFNEYNIKFTSMSENFDTSTPLGMATLGILSVFAELERSQIKERMALGRNERAKEGKFHGGAGVPIGYRYIPEDDKMVIDDYEAMQVRRVFEMFIAGNSINSIHKYLRSNFTHKRGDYSRTDKTVYNMLKNKTYLGLTKHRGEIYEGQHEPIISQETFDKAQKLMKLRKNEQPETSAFKIVTLFGGLLRCKKCGSRLSKFTSYYKLKDGTRKQLDYYKCQARARSAKTNKKCLAKSHRIDKFDDIIINEILKLNISFVEDKVKEIERPQEIKILNDRLKGINSQISKLLELYSLGNVPPDILADKVEKLNSEKQMLENQIKENDLNTKVVDIEEVEMVINSAKEVFDKGTFKEKRNVIKYLINEILVDDDEIEIHWSFC